MSLLLTGGRPVKPPCLRHSKSKAIFSTIISGLYSNHWQIFVPIFFFSSKIKIFWDNWTKIWIHLVKWFQNILIQLTGSIFRSDFTHEGSLKQKRRSCEVLEKKILRKYWRSQNWVGGTLTFHPRLVWFSSSWKLLRTRHWCEIKSQCYKKNVKKLTKNHANLIVTSTGSKDR